MSILIKGMEMPKKGEYRMTLYVCDDGYAYMDVDLFPVDKDRFEAVPVPPHGDLVDRDQMLNAAKDFQNWCYDLTDLPEFAADLPVIIPAEPLNEEVNE